MSFYGTDSDIVRRKFTSSTPLPPKEPTKELEKNDQQEKKLASEKRDLLDLQNQVNTVKVVDSTENSGFYCAVCNITLKDSSSYLDHVNSRAHGRNLGLEMRVERATFQQVKDRIEYHKRKLLEPVKNSEEIIQEKRKLQQELLEKRRQDKKLRKIKEKESNNQNLKDEDDSVDDPMFKLLGFSNFNSSKKP